MVAEQKMERSYKRRKKKNRRVIERKIKKIKEKPGGCPFLAQNYGKTPQIEVAIKADWH